MSLMGTMTDDGDRDPPGETFGQFDDLGQIPSDDLFLVRFQGLK